ncbi:SHOCT domain-containing protein [Clostridium oceanicum]|uniref:SHOCT domain-containing protein n=1 Tax=Clostridium oceanicum TaxID=1543 RepID=A0ABP3UQC4_9CLOT
MFCGGYGNYSSFAGGTGSNLWFFGFFIIKVLIFIGIAFFIAKLVKKYFFSNHFSLKSLDDKYVNGEIDEEEYLRRKDFIKNNK